MERAWPLITNREALKVNQQWAGHPGRLVRRWTPAIPSLTEYVDVASFLYTSKYIFFNCPPPYLARCAVSPAAGAAAVPTTSRASLNLSRCVGTYVPTRALRT